MQQLQKKLSKTNFKIKYVLMSIYLFCAMSVFAQEGKSYNSVYCELGGNGLYYSINYERLILKSKIANYGLRGGIAFFTINTNRDLLSFPFEFNIIFGQNKSHIEFAPGYTLIHEHQVDEKNWGSILFLRLGYRYQKGSGGFVFRAGFTPYTDFLIDYWDTPQLSLWFGISAGYSF